MTQPVLVRQSTAARALRLRRDADAYDELLLRRLGERGEPPGDFAVDGELPGADEVLIDTALYHAAADRGATARVLVRRERLAVAAVVALVIMLTAKAIPRGAGAA